jgi:hypothetical protein
MAIFFLCDVDGVAFSTFGYQNRNHDSFLGTYLLTVLFFIKGKVSRVKFKTKFLALHFIRQPAGYMH